MAHPALGASALVFHDTTFTPIDRQDGQIWLTAAEIAAALGYARADFISRIYDRNKDEFTSAMTETVNLTVSGEINGLQHKSVRLFSLRGAHLLAMFSRTPVAAEFRRWVLDILDREVGALRDAVDVRALLLDGQSAPTLAFPPEIDDAINERTWALTREAHALIHEHLRRRVAYCAVVGYPERRIDTALALEAVKRGRLGEALAHQYHEQLKGLEMAASSIARASKAFLQKVQSLKPAPASASRPRPARSTTQTQAEPRHPPSATRTGATR